MPHASHPIDGDSERKRWDYPGGSSLRFGGWGLSDGLLCPRFGGHIPLEELGECV